MGTLLFRKERKETKEDGRERGDKRTGKGKGRGEGREGKEKGGKRRETFPSESRGAALGSNAFPLGRKCSDKKENHHCLGDYQSRQCQSSWLETSNYSYCILTREEGVHVLTQNQEGDKRASQRTPRLWPLGSSSTQMGWKGVSLGAWASAVPS